MATIVNDRDVLLQAAGTRLISATLPSNWTTEWTQVTGSAKPSDYADVTATVINGGLTVTGGGITLSAGGAIKGGQTAYDSGIGFFLGYSGVVYKFSIGDSAGNKLTWDGVDTLTITGDITAKSITATGPSVFSGTYTYSGVGAALHIQPSSAGTTGLSISGSGASGTHNLVATMTAPGTSTVITSAASNGIAIEATGGSSTGTGIKTSAAIGLNIVTGTLKWNTYNYAAPAATGIKFMRDDGNWADLSTLLQGVGTDTAATAGSRTLPANPAGFLIVDTYSTSAQVKIPYYNL